MRELPELLSSLSAKNNSAKKSEAAVNEVVVKEYVPLVKFIAKKFFSKIPRGMELDELVSCGVIGLIDAIKKFNPSKKNKFKTYAEFRIRGAILDEIRDMDWVPRSIREKSKKIEKSKSELNKKLGRPATNQEIAEDLGLSDDKFQETLSHVQKVSLVSYEDTTLHGFYPTSDSTQHGEEMTFGIADDRNATNPLEMVNFKWARARILSAIHLLPDKERQVMFLYYYEGLKIKEIGDRLKLTSARISQLHASAISTLKESFKDDFDSSEDIANMAA